MISIPRDETPFTQSLLVHTATSDLIHGVNTSLNSNTSNDRMLTLHILLNY